MGSSCFFRKFEDYKQKDYDELCIMDTFPIKGTNVLNFKKGTKDVFFFRNMNKEGFIEDTLESKVPMRAGKFLVREFAEHLGMTVDDLRLLAPAFESMDDKHTYEKVIYNAYLTNNDFSLTDNQLNEAYSEYKRTRQDIYGK